MRGSDLPGCLRLTQAERWPHRLEDWQLHFDVGSGNVATTADGKLVGVAMYWAWGKSVATIGLVLVDQDMQGRGIGGRLMSAVMSDTAGRTQKLMATTAGLRLYDNCGFGGIGRIGQIQGNLGSTIDAVSQPGIRLRALTDADLACVTQLDRDAFGDDRHELLSALMSAGRGVIAEREGSSAGFAIIRSSGHGQTVGPVVATDEQTAIALVSQLLSTERGFIRLDAVLSASSFAAWLETIGLNCIDQVTIMTRGNKWPPSASYRTLGLVSQALG